MASVNKITLIGKVGADPEVRYLPNGTCVATLSLATSEKWTDKPSGERKERTEWHRVVFWGRLAEMVGEYVGKGKEVYLQGKNRTRSYEKDSITRYVTEVHADEFQLTGNKASNMPAAPNDNGPDPGADDYQDET